MANHQELKHQYLMYREVARKLYENNGMVDSKNITVSQRAPVQVVEGGAFIEATVFVSKEEFDKCTS